MQTKGNKILRNVFVKWIFMLSLAESDGRIQYFVVEDGLDNPTNQ
jgi:hypothetical protein